MPCNRIASRKGLSWVSRFLIPLCLGGMLGVPSHIFAAETIGVELSKNFVDGMTLPAYKAIAVSGRAPQGHTLDVKLVRNNTTVTMARVTVKSDSNWYVSLNPQSPGGPFQLKVIDKKRTEVVNDIYIGRRDKKIINSAGGITLSTTLSDNMHLQPGEEINISGLATPKSSLDIKLIKNQKTITMARVQASGDGQWQVTMPAQSAGGPFQLVVSNGSQKKVIRGIIIGQADVIETVSTPIKKKISNPIKDEFLGVAFDDSSWPLVKLTSLEKLPDNEVLLARKHVNFASAPKTVSLSLGENHQVERIYINGKLLQAKEWQSNALNINVPSTMFQSGTNVVALLSKKQWDNTSLIGTKGSLIITINNYALDVTSNWRVFSSSSEGL